jgi:hypothetical protein
MTTLGALKTRIADDLARSDLTTQIGDAIGDAIAQYQSTRFYFNETRAVTFALIPGQSLYGAADCASIPLFFQIDDVFITVSGRTYPLVRADADLLEELAGSTLASGDPNSWAWIDQALRVYPVPNAARTIRLVGALKRAAPASDGEIGNVWMTEAFELIRCHAKGLLYSHVIKSAESTGLMLGEDGEGGLAGLARMRLERETSAKRATGALTPTAF